MTIIKPFKAIRPAQDYAYEVAALPYDVYTSAEARKAANNRPLSFLHIDRSEIDLAENIDIHSKQVYQKAADNLKNMLDKNILIKEDYSCLYLYRLTMDGRSQTGLVCCSSIDDYLNGTIKKHELTRADKELDRINHVDYCNANTGPIFLTYHGKNEIKSITENWAINNSPIYDFIADDNVRHECWKIDNEEIINNIVHIFKEIPNTYIADGHHRAASAVKVGLKRREAESNFTGKEEYNYFLTVLFPHDELHIMDYNRVIKNLNGLSKDDFINKIEKVFHIRLIGNTPYKPEKKGTMGMLIDNEWYKLTVRKNILNNLDTVQSLDVSILQDEVLTHILGIKDIRTDDRIDFVGGIRGLSQLEKRCNEDMRLAFSMYPTSINELISIADENKLMPPKSTWFEPKLRSGLFIHEL